MHALSPETKNCSGYRVSFNTCLPAFTAMIAALRGKKIPHTAA
jgi:hypothetical protein